MVRSLYSGVGGMKAHQTRLDVIGNNIANVNTIGFKSSSVTFRDLYYQSMRGAAAGDSTKGGVNPSMVGYGSQLGSIDLNMAQSASSATGNAWDVSIGGEGFLQVQDSDGNIYYTRAGKLGYDANGYLVDSNGNFVLGTNAVDNSVVGQQPGSQRIKMTVPSLNPTKASGTLTASGIVYTMTAGTESEEGNVTFNLATKELPIGQKASAVVGSGGITVYLNSKETFTSLDDLNTAINDAITTANGNKAHPGGPFTISSDKDVDFGTGLTGSQIVNTAGGADLGTITMGGNGTAFNDLGFTISEIGEGFTAGDFTPSTATPTAATTFAVTDSYDAASGVHTYTVTMTVNNQAYTGTITSDQLGDGGTKLYLKRAGGAVGDTITLSCPSQAGLIKQSNTPDADGSAQLTFTSKLTGGAATPSTPSKNLGLGSQGFKLENGTAGGPQTIEDVSGLKIGADGVISAVHAGKLIELGRIDLATFMNPNGLEQVGSTYFSATANSGDPSIGVPGSDGTGPLASSTLEMSNVDLSQEFADMITTQRGFQANSRMITVSDTLLEELINLKR